MTFANFFNWAAHSSLGFAIRDSRIAFPIIEMVHLLGLGLLLGSLLIVNGRFFGVGMRRQTTAEVLSDFAPWTRLALLLMVASGIPMFASKADDLWENSLDFFTTKMVLLLLAVLVHYLLVAPLARKNDLRRGRFVAALSLCLWFSASLAGLSLEFL